MTCWFDPHDGGADIYDHEGAKVASDYRISDTWRGRFPIEVKDALRENMDGNQPSAYNQALLADLSTDNIKEGTPP